MDAALSSAIGAGWASGVNLYATVLLLGVFGRFGVADVPEALQSVPVLAAAAVLFLIELVADKIPYLDNVWDAIHTVIRPAGAAVVGALLVGDDLSTAVASLTSGGVALGSHLVKAGTRLAVNVSPEPVSNILVSFAEDGLVAVMVWFVLTHPVVAAVLALVFLAVGVGVVVLAWRAIRRGLARLRARRRQTV
jgi:hypothetical protein